MPVLHREAYVDTGPGGGGGQLAELTLGIEGKRCLWLALGTAAAGNARLAGPDYPKLVRRAEEQRGRVDPLAVAEAYSFLQDWNGLHAWVDEKNWGDEEFFRLAVLSHALHHLTPGDRASMESQTAWAAALKATRNRTDRLAAVAQLAEGWDYAEEAADAWWLIANGNENAKEALTALQRLYKAKQNSHGLLRVAKRALELNPADLVAANNCASLGLLLTGDSSARRLATRLHAENPTNAALSSTYAFALFTEGKTSEALREMETLKEAQLRHPAIAAYYFVLLVENGKMERAHSFLSAANKAQLLPEEQQLLTAATRKLLQHDSQSVMKTASADS